MADTGLLTFTNVGQLTDAVNSANSWTGLIVSNLNASDALNATYVLAENSTTLSRSVRIRTISNHIPTGATITGYEVKFDLKQSVGGTAKVHRVQLVNNSVVSGLNKANLEQPPSTDTLYTFGGSNDLWGTNYDATDVNGLGFGVEIQFQGGLIGSSTVRIDLVQIIIYYVTSVNFTKNIGTSIDSNQNITKNIDMTFDSSQLFTSAIETNFNASALFMQNISTTINSAQQINRDFFMQFNAVSNIIKDIILALNSSMGFNKNQNLQFNSSEIFEKSITLQINASIAWIKNIQTSVNSLTLFTQNIVTVFLASDYAIPINPHDVLPVHADNPHVKIALDAVIMPLKINKIIDFSDWGGIIKIKEV